MWHEFMRATSPTFKKSSAISSKGISIRIPTDSSKNGRKTIESESIKRKTSSRRSASPIGRKSTVKKSTSITKSVRKSTTLSKKSTSRNSFASQVRFDSLDVHPATLKALKEVFKYEFLSKQQAEYMPQMLGRKDILVKASTGSGKGIAFLIPSIESLIGSNALPYTPGKAVGIIIILPTRELAIQIEVEARRLLTFHKLKSQVIVGGVCGGNGSLKTNPPDILVATPGRLDAAMNELKSTGIFSSVRVLILDEVDRLLDFGFAPSVRKIVAMLPDKEKRRTLLLSATVPIQILAVAKTFMRSSDNYEYIEAGGPMIAGQAHKNIKQIAIVCPPGNIHLELARQLLAHHNAVGASAKVMVFFPSVALVELYSTLFRAHVKPAWASLYELHGNLKQNKRNQAADAFRKPGGVLFASDAAGRGMDFPAVSLVVQMGVTATDTYLQRVGRTGRAGASGEAIIILGEDEAKAVPLLKAVEPALVKEASSPFKVADRQALSLPATMQSFAEKAFRGLLGTVKMYSKQMGWSPQDTVDAVAARLLGMGMMKVPDVNEKTLGKMGLRGVSFDTAAIKTRIARRSNGSVKSKRRSAQLN